ncbi:MAG: 3-deoxy-7-phosphoheptulonate synthase [Pseudomonadota bacterium]
MSTSNKRIKAIDPIQPPQNLLSRYPLSDAAEKLVNRTRGSIGEILHGRDPRLLVVVGPCSIHDVDAALEYAGLLSDARQRHAEQLEIVMRVYFEKPRSTVGWKGLINDPDLDQSFRVNKGLELARKLLLDLNNIGMPAGCEFLDAVTGQYYADLVSWGAIGARTTESQIHRELASGLSCPVGFKNGTNGNINIAADAVISTNTEHIFLSPTEGGQTALFTTTGNQDAHLILRGGQEPNYDADSVAAAAEQLSQRQIQTGIMIDFSHANSLKKHKNQLLVGANVAEQISAGNRTIIGCMIESHLKEGNQKVLPGQQLVYGQSITDACLAWTDTDQLLAQLAAAVAERRSQP